jgi:hypothetical protein
MRNAPRITLSLALLVSGCTATVEAPALPLDSPRGDAGLPSDGRPKAIFGRDDRLEWFEAEPALQALSQYSTAFVTSAHNLRAPQEPTAVCRPETLAEGQPVCTTADGRRICAGALAMSNEGCASGEARQCWCGNDGRWSCPTTSECRPFADPRHAQFALQPTRAAAGFCSDERYLHQSRIAPRCAATLIDGHTVVTAGHCVSPGHLTGELPCNDIMVVFNRRMEGPTVESTVVRDRDIYYCHEVLAGVAPSGPRGGVAADDYVVFTIKRDRNGSAATPVSEPYRPIGVQRSRPALRSAMWTIGHPTGLPVKISPGDLIRVGAQDFGTSADAFAGNSGGGVFTRNGGDFVLSGILVRTAYWDPVGRGRAEGCEQTATGTCTDLALGCTRDTVLPRGESTNVWIEHALAAVCDPTHPNHLVTRPTHLCGTAPPVSPVPYVPAPRTSSGGEPRPPAREGSGSGTCSVSRGAASAGPVWLLGLVLVVWGLRRRRPRRAAHAATLAALVLAGCSPPASEPTVDAGLEPIAPGEPAARSYVASYIFTQTRDGITGHDYDGDARIDNRVGRLAEVLADHGVSLERFLYDRISTGSFVLLATLEPDPSGARLVLVQGRPLDGPLDHTGEGVFRVSASATAHTLRGQLRDDAFVAHDGRLHLELPIERQTLPIPLEAVRVQGPWSEHGATLELGGLVPAARLDDVRRALAGALSDRVGADSGCPSACEDPANDVVLALIDLDRDARVSADELAASTLGGYLEPDIDVDGDGTADHLSFGARIGWVRAWIER